MTAKQYLSRIRLLDIKISNKIQELKELRQKVDGLSSVTLVADRGQTSHEHDRISKDIGEILELEARIVRQMKELEILKHKIINEIGELKNPLFVKILFERYVKYKSLEAISVEINYSYRQTKRLHGYALLEFERCPLMSPLFKV